MLSYHSSNRKVLTRQVRKTRTIPYFSACHFSTAMVFRRYFNAVTRPMNKDRKFYHPLHGKLHRLLAPL
ncbi:hypothetical protein L5515_011199 [Caenorhabditis briggsae]|uniref:Uncharacterized protein n=1 Tax=Caenorhabditis briggsae TaxID=6238 RepID=A0AAE9EWQ5_CAEBR|nr:hypothetical protein L3Y34_004077 [Caenorhabditis briggsae]UMM28292.1 hypothetical protein L5515_011199 [Caenorhabditis briggsae]